jgi:hypothetical protein
MHDHHLFVGDTYLYDTDIMWGKAMHLVASGQSRSAVETFELR